jgi:hypothetical protein
VGVFATDRFSGEVYGASNRLWRVLGESLQALGGRGVAAAWVRDGYVPSWLAHEWGAVLFERLGELVLACRPDPHLGPGLHPVSVYRRGSPTALALRRAGEQLSAYETELASPALLLAQFLTASSGCTVTTLRPPAPGSVRSPVAVRRLIQRSGLLHPHPNPRRVA